MNTNDMSKMWTDMLGAFPVDGGAMKDAFRTQAELAERLSKVVLDAAETSTEISAQWTKDTIAKMHDMTAVRDEPSDYTKAVTEFASAQADMTAQTMARFAEVAKKVQMETVEMMLAAGKDVADDAATVAKSAAEKGAEKAEDATEKAAGATRRAASKAA